jgi:hypothetical protein
VAPQPAPPAPSTVPVVVAHSKPQTWAKRASLNPAGATDPNIQLDIHKISKQEGIVVNVNAALGEGPVAETTTAEATTITAETTAASAETTITAETTAASAETTTAAETTAAAEADANGASLAGDTIPELKAVVAALHLHVKELEEELISKEGEMKAYRLMFEKEQRRADDAKAEKTKSEGQLDIVLHSLIGRALLGKRSRTFHVDLLT